MHIKCYLLCRSQLQPQRAGEKSTDEKRLDVPTDRGLPLEQRGAERRGLSGAEVNLPIAVNYTTQLL